MAFGQGAQLPKYTVATLPAASSYPTYIVQVIDGSTASDCTTGGGTYNVLCLSHAGAWTPVASSSSVSVNGTPISDPNLNGTTPAAVGGYVNGKWQVSGSNVSVQVPQQSSTSNGQCYLGIQGLVGAFANSSGVPQQALCIGNGGSFTVTSSTVDRILVGINDNHYADNTGSFSISVSKNGAAPSTVTVAGTAMPWNPTNWPYGANDGTSATVALTGLTVGDTVTLTYLSGTVQCGSACAGHASDANGWLSVPPGSACLGGGPTGQTPNCNGYGFYPTYYMSAANAANVVTSINGTPGAFTFTGAGVSCTATTCTFAGGMVYPSGTGIPQVSSGTSWGTTLTAATLGGFLSGQTGCSTAGYPWVPADEECEAAAASFTLTTTGTSGAATYSGGVLNIPVYSSGGGGGSLNLPVDAQTGTTYTLVLGDATNGAGMVTMNSASSNTVTVPPHSSVAFPVGTWIQFVQLGAGQTTLAAGAGVTLTTPTSLSARAQYSTIGIVQISTDVWIVQGDTQ